MGYNGVIREYSTNSVKVLARILVADLNDFPADWKIRYQSQEIDRTTTTLDDLCCGPQNPLQIYKPVKNGFPITIRTIDGESFEVVATTKDSKEVLKIKIAHVNSSYPPNSQKLVFSRQHLHLPEAAIYLTCKLGPDSLAILTSDPKPRRSDDVPSWARYAAGINICGECPNPECVSNDALGKKYRGVVKSFSYGEIRLNLAEDTENVLACPACSTPTTATPEPLCVLEDNPEEPKYKINPKFLLVSKGRTATFERLADSHQIVGQVCNTNWDYPEQELKLSGQLDRLEVTTVKLHESPFSCIRCDTRIMKKSDETRLLCGHVYHKECTTLSSFKGCKICKIQMVIVGSWRDVIASV